MKRIQVLILALSIVISGTAQTLNKGEMIKTATGLQVLLQQASDGDQPMKGDKVSVHYTGRLTDSTIFDSSVSRSTPFEFVLGQGQVIKGWDEGIAMLKVGEKAQFTIPPALGYGERGSGIIPPNSTLVFDVELVSIVQRGSRPYDVKGLDTITTPSGLQYVMVQQGNGTKVKPGMKVKVHYSGYLLNGDKFDSSVDRGQPIELTVGKRQVIQGWEEGLALLSVGDRAKLVIPYQLAYGEAGRAPLIPPKATLIFDVEIVDAVEVQRPQPFVVAGKDTLKTASGLKYIKLNTTDGIKPVTGNTVVVHYTGFFESGEIFDSSVERGQPFEFEVGMGKVIRGWDEGLQLLHKGEKARLIVPWQLGYGENAYGPIPAKATLIFDVELLDVR
jgi:peptidylprolyl isomerase